MRAPERVGSVVVARGLSCPAACGILFPRPGIELASPALEGGFLTAGRPGKSRDIHSRVVGTDGASSPLDGWNCGENIERGAENLSAEEFQHLNFK